MQGFDPNQALVLQTKWPSNRLQWQWGVRGIWMRTGWEYQLWQPPPPLLLQLQELLAQPECWRPRGPSICMLLLQFLATQAESGQNGNFHYVQLKGSTQMDLENKHNPQFAITTLLLQQLAPKNERWSCRRTWHSAGIQRWWCKAVYADQAVLSRPCCGQVCYLHVTIYKAKTCPGSVR